MRPLCRPCSQRWQVVGRDLAGKAQRLDRRRWADHPQRRHLHRSDAVAVQLAWYEGELALHVRTDEWAVLTKRTALDVAASIIQLASQMPD